MSAAPPPPNYDLPLLTIELLEGPYVYPDGVEPEPDDVFADGDGWVSVADVITNITTSQATELDTLNQAPRAGSATLTFSLRRGVGAQFFTSLYGRQFRIAYNGVTLFAGQAVQTEATVRPDPIAPTEANSYAVTCTLRGGMRNLNLTQLDGFTAPAETVDARLERLMAAYGFTVQHSFLDTFRLAATAEPQYGSLLSTCNELALAAHARWYTNNENELVMRGSPPDVSVAFDPSGEPGTVDYLGGVQYGTSDDWLLSETVARLKSDEDIVHVRRNGAATQKRSQEFIVDLDGPESLEAWSLVVKHQRKSPFIPHTIRTHASPDIDWNACQPTTLATVKLPYRSVPVTTGISAIRHDISPRRWTTTFSLVPRYFLLFDELGDVL